MNNVAIAVHGGASEDSSFLQKNKKECMNGLTEAVHTGHNILQQGGSALDAVEAAIKILEDNPLFNAGRGSALNCKGEVEMDASIMDGSNLKAGAISMVRNIKNPISLARAVMEQTRHVFFSGYGAQEVAHRQQLPLEPDSYFITEHQYDAFASLNKQETRQDIFAKKIMGTVGAVALDQFGTVVAGTSTGGTSNCLAGRIGDSCVIGAGCYANNDSCAVSGTGEGEFLITGAIAHSIAMYIELKKMSVQEACDYVIHMRNKHPEGEIGVISITPSGAIGMSFNTEIMKRASIDASGQLFVAIE